MIQREVRVYSKDGAAAAATPPNIDPIGRPGIHLISGPTGVGKSNVARNIVDAYEAAHKKAGTQPRPDYVIFTGAGGDPVWSGAGKRVKVFTPKEEGEFVDHVNRIYNRAEVAKGPAAEGLGKSPERFKPDGEKFAEAVGGKGSGDEAHRPTMIVIDDAAASSLLPTLLHRSPIAQAVQSHRHADMSFVASSQRYHGHNPWLRANAATASVFPPRGAEEVAFLRKEMPIPHAAMMRGFSIAQAKGKHHFVHVDMGKRVATHGFSGELV